MLSRSYENDYEKLYSIMAIRLWLQGGMTLREARMHVARVAKAKRLALRAIRLAARVNYRLTLPHPVRKQKD
jgi:hypothetical protein